MSRIHHRTPASRLTGVVSLVAALLLAPFPSRAAFMGGPDLLTACASDGAAKATCDGYLMAVTDLILRREANARGQGKLCVPTTITIDQVRDAVLHVGQGTRAARAPSGLGVVAIAMRRAWPCQDTAPNGPSGNSLDEQ